MPSRDYRILRTVIDAAVSLEVMAYENGDKQLPDLDEKIACFECLGDGCHYCNGEGFLPRGIYYSTQLIVREDWFFAGNVPKPFFDDVVECISVMSFEPGGITFLDTTYESKKPNRLFAVIRKITPSVKRIRAVIA